jgi:hypothetical protein
MNRYLIVGFSSFIIEVASTMYIATVANRSFFMIFWAFIGPFLSLPFVGYLVETKCWRGRSKLALSSAIGYSIGAYMVYLFGI